MSTGLNLPAPTQGSTSEPAVVLVDPLAASKVDDFLAGLILPPPEIRGIVDKTAAFIAKNAQPAVFEDKMRAREKTDSRFAFMNKADAYHAYYQHALAEERRKVKSGEVVEAKKVEVASAVQEQQDEQERRPTEPPALEFLIDTPPTINAVDLDILRLTALFTARSGRHFTAELSSREARNYQFDFLRPGHSLFGYFNRTVEQYTKLLVISNETRARLERRSGGLGEDMDQRVQSGRKQVLKDAQERAEWEKYESGRQQLLDDQLEAERIAIAEIDWQDFVVVSTVEFTEGDEAGLVELPPPMSISEVENMTIAQKKMAAMIMEGREEEIVQDAEEEEEDMAIEEDDEPVARVDKEKQKAVEIKMADSAGPMKIRKDYVPKSKRAPVKAAPVLTKFGDQQVAVEDFAEHVRIELLDPRWKEEKRLIDANRSASNLLPGGTDVSASLRALAANRADIFGTGGDNERLKQADEAMRAVQKEREKKVWDGHTAKEVVTDRFQSGANLDEQIAAIHKAKGLLGVENGAGPQIGPARVVAAPVVEEPIVPTSFLTGSTISAAPQPHRSTIPIPQNPYAQQQQQQQAYAQSAPSSGYNLYQIPSAAPAVQDVSVPESTPTIDLASIPGLPARPPVAAPGEDLPAATLAAAVEGATTVPVVAPQRTAVDAPEGEPSAKRQKQTDVLYSEEDWMARNEEPVSLTIQLPEYAKKPEWGCDGSQILLEDIPLSLLVGTLRDRIQIKIGLPVGKQRLSYRGKLLGVNITLASLNISSGDSLSLAVRK